ncbi:MAG: sigma-70 family RNA polymerase sigma factor [Tepidisphaeraceae bacterium]
MPQRNEPDLSTRATLFQRIKAPEPGPRKMAWEEFCHRYSPVIAGFARNLGARPQDIDDLIQDVLLGFFAQAPTFMYDPSKGRFRGYLKTCTFHALHAKRNQNFRFRAVPLEDVDPNSVDLEQAWNTVWDEQKLKRVLDAARTDYQDNVTFRAFEQYAVQGQSPPDVARSLGISVDSVYKAKERVIARMREWRNYFEENDGPPATPGRADA